MLHQWFARARLSIPYMTCLTTPFNRNVHHRGHYAEAAYGCLEPAPISRLRRAYLHLGYSIVLTEDVHDTSFLYSFIEANDAKAALATVLPIGGLIYAEGDLISAQPLRIRDVPMHGHHRQFGTRQVYVHKEAPCS